MAASLGNPVLYQKVFDSIAAQIDDNVARKFAETETNEFGQTAREVLARTRERNEQREKLASEQDMRELLSLGFFGFVHAVRVARNLAWQESKAESLLDTFRTRKHLLTRGLQEYAEESDTELLVVPVESEPSPSFAKKGRKSMKKGAVDADIEPQSPKPPTSKRLNKMRESLSFVSHASQK